MHQKRIARFTVPSTAGGWRVCNAHEPRARKPGDGGATKGNQLARHPHEDDVDDCGRVSGPFSSTGVARQQHADYPLHQKSVCRLLDEMDCAALGAECTAAHIKAREVELWLASVQRARTTRAKIRNVMSLLFNHARRYDLFDGNPIQWVRQSAKRRSAPNVLTIEEVRHLLAALPPRERILVFLDVSTGLRQSELFGLQWQDIDFEIGELSVTRSVVGQVVGTCKTEASQKAIPLHENLIEALKGWRQQNPYMEAQHWVFASPSSGGKNPYGVQQLMRRDIRPVAEKLGITKRIGWHTFRHTYSTLLRAVGADLKVMQELLRHSTIRVTLDTYTQAVTAAKRTAHTAVVSLIIGNGE